MERWGGERAVSAMLDFAEYHDWIIVSRKLQESGFLPVCQPVFLQIPGTYGTSHAGTIYLWVWAEI